MDQWSDPDLLDLREPVRFHLDDEKQVVQRASISSLLGNISLELCQLTPRGMTVEAMRESIDQILPPDEARFGQFPMKLTLPFKAAKALSITSCCKLMSIRRISQTKFRADFQFLDLTDEGHRLISVFLQEQQLQGQSL